MAEKALVIIPTYNERNNLQLIVPLVLGQDPAEIRRVAKETLEGHLRGVLARMTPEEVNEDRLKFADELVHEASDDFDRLGLALIDGQLVDQAQDRVDVLAGRWADRVAHALGSSLAGAIPSSS